jgi:hypothetical protein
MWLPLISKLFPPAVHRFPQLYPSTFPRIEWKNRRCGAFQLPHEKGRPKGVNTPSQGPKTTNLCQVGFGPFRGQRGDGDSWPI